LSWARAIALSCSSEVTDVRQQTACYSTTLPSSNAFGAGKQSVAAKIINHDP
jgi:hypothetical protein